MTAVARATLTVAGLPPWLGKAYAAVADLLTAQRAGPAGPPFARFHTLGGGRFEVEAGFPTSFDHSIPGHASRWPAEAGLLAVGTSFAALAPIRDDGRAQATQLVPCAAKSTSRSRSPWAHGRHAWW